MSEALVFLILIPLLTAILVALMGAQRLPAIRWVSLGSTAVSLLLSIAVAAQYLDTEVGPRQATPLKKFEPAFQTNVVILPLEKESARGPQTEPGAVRFHIGIDGISLWLVVLTSLLMVCAVLGSWTAITERVNEYYAWMLMLQMAMVGVFLSVDVVLFYVFFELTLIPLFFLIGIWGGPQRQYAARKFFVITLTGSLITLLGVFWAILAHYNATQELTLSIPRLAVLTQEAMNSERAAEWLNIQWYIFALMMVGFAVKVPLVPVHTWLPLAHTEAPTAGSVLLAGVLLKLGTYGFLRMCLPIAPDACVSFGAPFIGTLAVIGIIYGAFCALMQDDIKKLVAYSSVSHLGLCMLGLFSLNEVGMMGGLLQMINHGLSTGALFLLVGMLYERYHTRKIADYSGMAAKLKILAVGWVFMTMSSIGLPGLNGFVGEITAMMGMYASKVPTIDGILLAALGALGVILGAWYMLTVTMKVFFGPPKEPHHEGHAIHDLNGREILTLAPLAAACLFIGMYSPFITRAAEPEIKYVADLQRGAIERRQKQSSTQAPDQQRTAERTKNND